MLMSALGTSLAYHLYDSVYDALSANTRRLVREAQQASRAISWAEDSFSGIFLADGSFSEMTSFSFCHRNLLRSTCLKPTLPPQEKVKLYNALFEEEQLPEKKRNS